MIRLVEHRLEIVFFKFNHLCGISPLHVAIVLFLTYGKVSIEINGQTVVPGTFGRYDYHAVRRSRTVDRSGCGIFQDCDVLYIIRVNSGHASVNRKTVDYHKGCCGGLKGADATDSKGIFILARFLHTLHKPRNLAFKIAAEVTDTALVEVCRGQDLIRAGRFTALDVLIAGHDYLVHHVFRRRQFNLEIGRTFFNLNPGCLHSNIRNHESGSGLVYE